LRAIIGDISSKQVVEDRDMTIFPWQQTSIFSGCTLVELESLNRKAEMRVYQANEVIMLEGAQPLGLYVLVNGSVRVSKTSAEGRELDVGLPTVGTSFGEIGLLDNKPNPTAAIALKRSEIAFLKRADFLEFVSQHPKVAIKLAAMFASKLRSVLEHSSDVAFLDAATRVAKRLCEQASLQGHGPMDKLIVIPFGQSELSRLVGTRRETVTKVLSEFKKQGFLTTLRGSIIIKRIDALRRTTERPAS
jgi:CRP/FNR family transcriptional regulator